MPLLVVQKTPQHKSSNALIKRDMMPLPQAPEEKLASKKRLISICQLSHYCADNIRRLTGILLSHYTTLHTT